MLEKIKNIQDELGVMFPERDDIITGLVCAILSKQNIVLLGPPGTAKSMIVNALQSKITGSKGFVYLFTKFTTPEEVFGPISLAGLEKDKFERILINKLPDSHFAFCDEVFKANSAILNSLLTIMNEKYFDNGTNRIKVPLVSLIGASNEVPQDDSLTAMYDRFALRYYTKYVQNVANFITLLESSNTPKTNTTITLEELKNIQDEVQKVLIKRNISDLIVTLRREFQKDGFSISDRRWIQSLNILRAMAYLDGKVEVTQEECNIYSHILWDKPEDRHKIASKVGKLINPGLQKILEFQDAAEELINQLISAKNSPNFMTQAAQTMAKIDEIKNQITTIDGGSKGKKIKEKMETRFKDVLKMFIVG